MKRVIVGSSVFGMANLVPEETGLSCDIWSDHKGIQRTVSHFNTPRVKITKGSYEIAVSIEPNPRILASSKNIPTNVMKKMKEAMKYVGRNYDLFLRHYSDDDKNEFTDLKLFRELAKRGEFKM